METHELESKMCELVNAGKFSDAARFIVDNARSAFDMKLLILQALDEASKQKV